LQKTIHHRAKLTLSGKNGTDVREFYLHNISHLELDNQQTDTSADDSINSLIVVNISDLCLDSDFETDASVDDVCCSIVWSRQFCH
jgi:hypothetical protein